MKLLICLAFVVISMWIPADGIESSEEAYWKMNFGNDVTMPKVVKESLLGSGTNKIYEANSGTGTGGKTPTPKPTPTTTININYGSPGSDKKHEDEFDKHRVNTFYALAKPNRPTLVYNSKSSNLPTDNSVLFFFEKIFVDLGSKMKLQFSMGTNEAKFKPSKEANSIPFSTNKLTEILKFFAIKPKSTIANLIEETLSLCENKPVKGEQKFCATSLEAMVNYVKFHLGDQVKALSTEVDKETSEEYQIESAKKIKSVKNSVCHKMIYPFAVFYCHTLSKTDIYQVLLVDSTGKKSNAMAVCHKDTSTWYPGHIAFQLLKVKPGSVPICHFLHPSAIIWVTK